MAMFVVEKRPFCFLVLQKPNNCILFSLNGCWWFVSGEGLPEVVDDLLAQKWILASLLENFEGSDAIQVHQLKPYNENELIVEWFPDAFYVSQRLRKFPEIQSIFLTHPVTIPGRIPQVLFWVYWKNVEPLFQYYGMAGPDSDGCRILQGGLWILVEVCKWGLMATSGLVFIHRWNRNRMTLC